MTFAQQLLASGEFIFGLVILSVVLILIFPLPTWMIDGLLGVSFAISILIIMTISYVKQPADFFVFPTVLLVVTLFRLGLNIATTRSILLHADGGELIATFGELVIGGNPVVGVIVFLVLTIINFIVITKGAGRVAEVSARFTLDAMPGKQMSIDADLNAGIINEQDARSRRKNLELESSFYGAMDGASKFVRGDAVAALLITAINLVGGFAVGMLQMDLTAAESIQKFTLLSIGDGLVAQIPALLISTAAGIIVTRSASSKFLGQDVVRQLMGSNKTLYITGGSLWLMMIVPGFPKLVLFVLGALFIAAGWFLPSFEPEEAAAGGGSGAVPGRDAKALGAPGALLPQEQREPGSPAEHLAIEIGFDLLPIVQNNLQNMLDRISALRRNLSRELGVNIPPISMRDNTAIPPHQYRFLLRGHEIAMGELYLGQMLAMGVGTLTRPLRGRVTVEPAFGLPATWISEAERREAERMGYAVVDPVSVLITHLSETIKSSTCDLLSRQDTQNLLDSLKQSNPALMQEMNTLQVGLGHVHRVLQNLLAEGLSVRELSVIIEKLCDQISFTKNPDELSEACRKTLMLEISRQLEIRGGKLKAITLSPDLEQQLVKCMRHSQQEIAMVLDPNTARIMHEQLNLGIQELSKEGLNPVLLCSPMVRLGVKRFFGDTFPTLKVVAYNEISPKIQLIPAHTVRV